MKPIMCRYFDWKMNVAQRVYYLRFILYISVKNINRWKVNLTFDCRTTYNTRPTVLNGYLSIREYTEWIIVAYRRYTGLVSHENEQNKSAILKYELNHNATLSWRICQFYNKNTMSVNWTSQTTNEHWKMLYSFLTFMSCQQTAIQWYFYNVCLHAKTIKERSI